jgi:hypothetical protein
MQNGHDNPQPQIQINPMEAANLALVFLARASFTAVERRQYDIAESLLQAIASGQVIIAPPPQPPQMTDLPKVDER